MTVPENPARPGDVLPEPAAARRIPPGIGVAVLIALAVGLRVALSGYPFWFDEYASLIFADQPLSHLWGPWMVRETNPPLFYTLAKAWHAVVGDSFVALRLLPIFGSACAMALLAMIARRSFGDRSVAPALVLYGLSASAIFISHQFRGYIFCEVGVLIALLGLVDSVGGLSTVPRNYGLYVAGSAVAVYSHTTMLLWPVVATLTVLAWYGLFRRQEFWRAALRLICANLVLLAVSAWAIWIALLQIQMRSPNIGWLHTAGRSDYLFLLTQNAMLAFYPSIYHPYVAESHVAKRVIQLALVLAVLRKDHTGPSYLLIILLGVGVAVIWAAQQVQPLVSDRTIHWLSLLVVLLIAGGIGQVRSGALRLAALAIPAAALVLNLADKHDGLVIENLPQLLKGVDPATAVVVTGGDAGAVVFARSCAMAYRRPHCPLAIVPLKSPSRADSWAEGLAAGRLVDPADLAGHLPPGRRIYTMRYGLNDPLTILGRATPDQVRPTVFEGPFTAAELLGTAPMPRHF